MRSARPDPAAIHAAAVYAAARLWCLQRVDALQVEITQLEAFLEDQRTSGGVDPVTLTERREHLSAKHGARIVVWAVLCAVESVEPRNFAASEDLVSHLLDVCAEAPSPVVTTHDGTTVSLAGSTHLDLAVQSQ